MPVDPQISLALDSRNDAYKKILPELSNKQKEVFEFLTIQPKPMSNLEISEAMHKRINAVTPRILELRKRGVVEDRGRSVCSVSGENVHKWASLEIYRVKLKVGDIARCHECAEEKEISYLYGGTVPLCRECKNRILV